MILSARKYLLTAALVLAALPLHGCKEETVQTASGEIIEIDAESAEVVMTAGARLQTEVAILRGPWMCVDSEFSFDRVLDIKATAYDNDFAPETYRCHVLNAMGGVEEETLPDIDWLEEDKVDQPLYGAWYYNGSHYVPGAGTGNGLEDDRDLIAFLPWLRADICAGINAALGIDGIPKIEGVQWQTPFQGTYTENGVALLTPARLSGCFNDGTKNVFYQVLLVR